MQNVAFQTEVVNPDLSIDKVCEWLEAQESKGDLPAGGARQRVTAIRAYAALVADGEPKSPQWLVDNLDQLERRWCNKHPEKQGETAKSYSSRARGGIAEYVRWLGNPAGYKPSAQRAERPQNDTKKVAPKMVAKVAPAPEPVAGAAAPATAPATATPPPGLRTLPLGGGRQLAFVLPEGGLHVGDVLRIAFHMVTLCEDYDGTVSPMQAILPAQRG